jgi:glutamate---cysteine ligase / carboxylate-amine ligase
LAVEKLRSLVASRQRERHHDDGIEAASPAEYALHEPPAWEATTPLTVESCARTFDHTLAYTIGVEEELMLVDAETADLAPVIDGVLARLGGDKRFSKELRAAQIEIVTPVCATAADACRELGHARRHLIERVDGSCRLLACGTHPFSTRHGEIAEAARYRQIADEYVWAATRSLVCGLHVHVAVPGADRALAVYNALRSYLPELAALAANSPYSEGNDTGMCSVRPKFNEIYPRSGIPPAFQTWEELVRFVEWGRSGGLFPDSTHFWWEMRLHPVFGTIEIRVADAQTRVDDATAVVAVIQALVARLSDQFDAGEQLPLHETYWINENAWRAHRYGVRGWLVDLDSGARVATRERLAELIVELEPYAARFDAVEQLTGAQTLLAGNGAERQRYVHAREGIVGLTRWLVDETEASALDA